MECILKHCDKRAQWIVSTQYEDRSRGVQRLCLRHLEFELRSEALSGDFTFGTLKHLNVEPFTKDRYEHLLTLVKLQAGLA